MDNSNNTKEETNMPKPKSYLEFLQQIKSKFKNMPEYYEIFMLDEDNKEIKINNEETFKKVVDILFIREIDKAMLEQSLFSLNYDKLSESQQDILDQKYNCILCTIIIKNENPYLCYKCQKIFHEKCLKDWDKKCKLQNKNLECPNCRNELPIEKWNKKLDYEENRKDNANLMNKINEYKLNNNMNNNINIIKDKKINELKEIKQYDLLNKYEIYINKTIEIFKGILNQINSIHNSLNLENSNKLNNLMKIYENLNINNIDLDDISGVIIKELEQVKNYIVLNKNINKKNDNFLLNENKNNKLPDKDNNIINKIENNNNNKGNFKFKMEQLKKKFNKKEITEYKRIIDITYNVQSKAFYNIFGKEFVENNKDNIDLTINGKKNELVNFCELKEGKNYITIKIKNKLTNVSKMFYWCKWLKDINELKYLDVGQCTNFECMFEGCSSLIDIKPLENWDVSKGNNFAGMFYKCSSLSDITPLKNWDVSNSNNFSSIFFECTKLPNIEPLENWKVFNCYNFDYMFSGCSLIFSIKPLENWNVSNGVNFRNMFDGCSSLSDLSPLRTWNVSNGISFEYMFSECKLISNVEPLKNWNVSNGNEFNGMFKGCQKLSSIEILNNWDIPKEKLKYIK